MKKFFLYPILVLLGLIVTLLLGLFLVLFFNPTLIVNPQNLDWVLRKTHILKKWSWDEAVFSHEWMKWNERNISGHFRDFCFEFDHEAVNYSTCLREISWNFKVEFFRGQGLRSVTNKPISIRGDWTNILLKETPSKEKGPVAPPDIWSYWSMLWSPLVPDMDFIFQKNKISTKGKEFGFDVELQKKLKELEIKGLGFTLWANPDMLKLMAPKDFEIPYDLKYAPRLHLYNTELVAHMKEEGIPVLLHGSLESIRFKINSFLDLPLKDGFDTLALRKKMFLATSALVEVQEVKKNIGRFAPKPFNVLPAPLSGMDGGITVKVTTHPEKKNELALVKAMTNIDLKSKEQVLFMDLGTDVVMNLMTFKPESILLGVDFKRVKIKLPRISKKRMPPQFLPDKRIQKTIKPKTEKAESKTDMKFKIEALGDKALGVSSNLLDEILRLNLDLLIENGNVEKGFVKILPLKTKVFKRPIKIPSMLVKFNYPAEPVLDGVIKFKLPQYEITMKLEGPISDPRYAFFSKPPLSLSDIYSVLLFGRPMSELDPDDKRAAGQTNEVLANGVLSLSVLYFLSGGTVEYVGYDPDSKNAMAQFGLGSKSSLRVGGDKEGLNSTGIRHSIGKGWFIDTSAQSGQKSSTNPSNSTNYGVMLERIIAY